MKDSSSPRPLGPLRAVALAAAVLVAGACSPPAPQDEPGPAASGEPASSADAGESSRVTSLNADFTTQAQLVEGLTAAVRNVERTPDSRGAPSLAFDLTLTNATGQPFDATGVAVFVFHGPDSKEALPAILEVDESGNGTLAHFDAPIPDGQEATVTYGFGVYPDHEQVLIEIVPEGSEGLYFSGTVPT
ncbi:MULTISPECIES: hypothetical protein [Nocardiopsidaceae]|uniref:DUF4352 domain-containing protein n=2 Tax=Nocardiopsidaceae TaxID=83676 RepID=A0ABY6YFC8_9ACTN|nr:hypothetical protein [Streptomonospora nanhaiensis]WAE70957.1 hypothetical protein OUQ99_17105 [Streptomonospora nanhaiensis]